MAIVVPPWTIGQHIKASALNVLNSAITEAQGGLTALANSIATQQGNIDAFNARATAIENATGVVYAGAMNKAEVVGQGAATGYGGWNSGYGFTAVNEGIAVPLAGVYICSLTIACSSGLWTGRTLHQLLAGGSIISRSSVPGYSSEDSASTEGITSRIAAGTVITPQYYAASGANRACVATLYIVRVSA